MIALRRIMQLETVQNRQGKATNAAAKVGIMCKPLLLKNAASSKHSNTKLTSVRKFIQSNATGASSMNGRVRSLFRTMTTPRAKNTRKTITDPNVGSKSLNLSVRPELAESVVAAAESVA